MQEWIPIKAFALFCFSFSWNLFTSLTAALISYNNLSCFNVATAVLQVVLIPIQAQMIVPENLGLFLD
jgi:hypothetical protein